MHFGGHKHSAHNRILSKYWRMNEREVISLMGGRKKDITLGTGPGILEEAGKGEAYGKGTWIGFGRKRGCCFWRWAGGKGTEAYTEKIQRGEAENGTSF